MASLAKTDKARSALQSRSPALGAMDRRLLILSDGQRSRESLLALFGPEVAINLDRLLREGYLDAGTHPRATTPLPAPTPSTPWAPTAPARRSLAAAKMYLLDMLQLQRSEHAASLRAAIQAADGEEALVRQLGEALRHLRATSAASYGERVASRLGELLPDAWLRQLEAVSPPPAPACSSAACSSAA